MYKYKAYAKGKSTKLNWAAESKGTITAVGVKQRANDGNWDRVILFIDAKSGSLKSEMIIPSIGESGTSSGFECVAFDDAGSLVASGFTGAESGEMNFKSSG